MVVRFEVDAFNPPGPGQADEDEDLLKAFSNLAVTKPEAPIPTKPGGLTIRRGGRVVPQSSLIELVSSSGRNWAWAEKYPQLYLSQTPWLFRASHRNGEFHEVEKVAVESPEVAEVAKKSKARFVRLREALQAIKDIVLEAGSEGRPSFVLEDGELVVYDRESQHSCLTSDAIALFS